MSGTSSRGGIVGVSGAFVGQFDGPLNLVLIDGDDVTFAVSPADPDIFITVSPTTGPGDFPTVTLTAGSAAVPFNFDLATPDSLANGLISRQNVAVPDNVNSVVDVLSKVSLRIGSSQTTHFSNLYVFVETPLNGGPGETIVSVMPIGADVVAMPSSGTATFNSSVFGIFASTTDGGTFVGQGTVTANFGAGSINGTFSDVDFANPSNPAGPTIENLGGTDFGLTFNATISGDDFSGSMNATGLTMTGDIEGDFYGPTNGAPVEIGGAFAVSGTGGAAFGGLQGIRN